MANRKQPWYTRLNPPSWSPKHGRNRQSPAPSYRDPSDRTDPDDGTADALSLTALNYTQWAIDRPEPRAPAIPYAGIRAGELTGHRMWLVLNEGLCSLAHYYIWQPGATIEGDVNAAVNSIFLGSYIQKVIYGGVYSFRNVADMMRSYYEENPRGVVWPTSIGFIINNDLERYRHVLVHGIAFGTIKCWGEVVEHECGYRAQFAKLATIDHAVGNINLTMLRERYLP